MNSSSILPHQNYESILFIGGPLDGQYQKVASGVSCYTYKNDVAKDQEEVQFTYQKRAYAWKNERTIYMMMMDGVPDSYQKYLAKCIKDGIEDNVPLPVVFMCLPSVEQFSSITK